MDTKVRVLEYFYTRIENDPVKAYNFLAELSSEDISLLAFSAVPFGPNHVELTVFPEHSDNFQALAHQLGWTLTGPQHAILIQGDDRLGLVAEIHKTLREAGVQVYASSGVTDGSGRFGYVIYTKEDNHPAAAKALATLNAVTK